MYYEKDSAGNLLRPLPGYYEGYKNDLSGAATDVLSETQRDYLGLDSSLIVLVSDEGHRLLSAKLMALKQVSLMCVEANYKMLPTYKRDNIYSGDPADSGYPDYLKGNTGRQTIAKLNKTYRDIANSVISQIKAATLIEELPLIVSSIIFPTEAEIMERVK